MEQYKQKNPYPPTQRENRIVYALIALIVILGVVAGIAKAVEGHWICESAAIYAFTPNARQAEWDSQAETWRVWNEENPQEPLDGYWEYWIGDENVHEFGIMYASPDQSENGPAYIEYFDTDTFLLWRFAFTDLIATPEGGREGHHHSCAQGPVVFSLSQGGL